MFKSSTGISKPDMRRLREIRNANKIVDFNKLSRYVNTVRLRKAARKVGTVQGRYLK